MSKRLPTREQQAQRIADSAKRLVSFCEANAPALIIEVERQLLFKKLMVFPVDNDAVYTNREIQQEIDREHTEFLIKHGYFDDVEGLEK